MKKNSLILITILVAFASLCAFATTIYAQNMTSGSGYEIVDPTINAGGNDDQSSTSGDYNLLESIGDIFNDERFESSNYKLGVGVGYTFMAHVPTITYFQTDDSSMENECGDGGCYDRARFELDGGDNPSDTLYLIEISSDDFATVQYVDGPTHNLSSSKDINDYLTESSWETGAWDGANILSLLPNTQYKIRARALNGNFTESSAGPSMTETTTVPYVYLDLNIADGTWQQTSPPHEIDLGQLGASVTTSSDYIWLDVGTNAVTGATVSVRDLYTGLKDLSTSAVIDSLDENLASESDGYGLRIDTTKWLPGSGQPGYLRGKPKYHNAGGSDYVGGLSPSEVVIMCSIDDGADNCDTGTGTPINDGRGAIWIKAKVATGQAGGDYTDTISFTALGSF